MNDLEKTRAIVSGHPLLNEEAGGSAELPPKKGQVKTTQRKADTYDFELAVEFTESRDDKLKGKTQFLGRIVDES